MMKDPYRYVVCEFDCFGRHTLLYLWNRLAGRSLGVWSLIESNDAGREFMNEDDGESGFVGNVRP